MTALPRDWLLAGYGVISLAVMLWDVLLAGQIAKARRQSRFFLSLTSICGLFIVPGALIALASATVLTGRTIHLVAGLWPLLLLVFVLQSGYALVRRHVTLLFALPIFVYNCTVFAAALARYGSGWIGDLPSALLGASVAQTGVLGLLFGREALWSPWLLMFPLLSPAYPARWRLATSMRGALAAGAAATVVLIAMQFPHAVYAAQSFGPLGSERLQERPRGDFALGLKIFPALGGAPAPLPISRDLALADTLRARIVSVTVLPSAVRALALDSLASTLDGIRRDSVLLVVALGYGDDDAAALARDAAGYWARRLDMIDQIVRRVRPDVLLPALDPRDAGDRALGVALEANAWQGYLRRAATLAHQLRPRTRVAFAVSSFSAADSALYAWGESERGIDLLGFSLAPSFGGGASLDTRLRLAERWMRPSRKEQWVFSARAFPRTFGEANQERAIWGVVAWATSQPKVRAVIVDGAGDYESLDGLRAPGGRLRPVVASVSRARQALAESTEGR